MTTVAIMKKDVLDIMSKYYKDVPYDKKNDKEIEDAGFLLKEHAASIREACKKHNLQVSFRVAGMDTLCRIKEGNPCKGHTILDKSIKEKGSEWTYSEELNLLEDYKGLVGYPTAGKNTPPALGGIWALIDNKQTQISLIDAKTKDIKSFFTGDYDMHDLLLKGKRILAGTPDESSTIHNLLVKMEGNSPIKIKDKDKVKGRYFESQYAWIRHGAQTSFISFLLNGKATDELKKFLANEINQLPLQGKVTTIDDKIIMFNAQGEAYLLDSLDKVYQYYRKNNLLDQIPFYFFFADLIKNNIEKGKIEGYSKELRDLLEKSVK